MDAPAREGQIKDARGPSQDEGDGDDMYYQLGLFLNGDADSSLAGDIDSVFLR